MAKLTYRKQGEIGKKTTLNHYQKMMMLLAFSIAINLMGIMWLTLNHLKN